MSLTHFVIYSRSYCHLCEDLQHALEALCRGHDFSIEMVDIDEDMALVERYDELVPVLVGQKPGRPPVRLCHYFLDTPTVRQFLLSEP